MQKPFNSSIIFFSILILLVSFFDLSGIINFNRYCFLFRNFPKHIILARYIFSITLRLLLVISAIGILFGKDIFRKIILLVSFFNILTIYWKHPISCFENILKASMIGRSLPSGHIIENSNLIAFYAMLLNYFFDIIFSLCLIYYFTRPKIKKFFNK